MFKRVFLVVLLLSGACCTWAQTGAVTGFCDLGGAQAETSGLNSTNYLQGIIPSCVVTVYLTGTQTLATLYANAGGTPLSNPFTASAAGSVAPGQWLFWAATNAGLDVTMSGGTPPNVFPSPVTLVDLYPSQSFSPVSGITQITGPSTTVTGGVTFNGSGVSQSGNTFTFSGGTSSTVNVNGSAVLNPNFNGSTPAPDSGFTAATWKVSGSSVIAEVPTSSASSGTVTYPAANTFFAFVGDSLNVVDYDTNTVVVATAGSCDGTNCIITVPTSTFHVGQHIQFQNELGTWGCLQWANAPILSTGFSSTQFEVSEAAAVLPGYSGCTGAQTGLTGNVTDATNLYPFQASVLPYFDQGGAVNPPNVVDWGVPGDTITAMNTNYTARYHRYSPTVTGMPGWLIVLVGGNDLVEAESAATIEAAYQGFETSAHADGWKIAVSNIAGQPFGCGVGCNSYAAFNSVQAWLRTNECVPGGTVTACADRIFDAGDAMRDPLNANLFQQSGTFAGHPTNAGASIFAAKAEEAFAAQGSLNNGMATLGANQFFSQQSFVTNQNTPETLSIWADTNYPSGADFPELYSYNGNVNWDVCNGYPVGTCYNLSGYYITGTGNAAELYASGTGIVGFGNTFPVRVDVGFSEDTTSGIIDVGNDVHDYSGGMKMTKLYLAGLSGTSSLCANGTGNAITNVGCAGGGTTTNALTANSSGGAAPGSTFNGSSAVTFDYHSFGATAPTGTITTGHCVEWASANTLEDAGAPCGSGGSSTHGVVLPLSPNGTPASPSGLYQTAPYSYTIAACSFTTTTADASTALTFNVTVGGASILSGSTATIAAGTAAGTVTALTLSGSPSVTAGQNFELLVTAGTSSWTGAVSCHS